MPNRIIKESIRESYSINALSNGAEILFYRMITYADDYGLFKADATLINSILFPLKKHKQDNVIKWLNEIANQNIIFFYVGSDGKPYGKFYSWEKHQNIRNHKPKYPMSDNCEELHTIQKLTDKCKQLISIDIKSPRNPIQSNPIQSNPNPIDVTFDFNRFWEIYPRKIAKGKALEKWKSKKCYLISEDIISALEKQVAVGHINILDLTFCPHPETWLNQDRWADPIVKNNQPPKEKIKFDGARCIDGKL